MNASPKLAMPVPKQVIRDQRCELCKWFHASSPAARQGECRRHPPHGQILVVNGQPNAVSCFPPVERDHYCGDYTLKITVN